MPLYEYECGSCGHRFERIQKFSDPPLTECPKCGGAVDKLISSPAIQFKGTGWYITDYAKSGKPEKSQAAAAKGDAGKGTAQAGKSADSSSGGTSGESAAASPAATADSGASAKPPGTDK